MKNIPIYLYPTNTIGLIVNNKIMKIKINGETKELFKESVSIIELLSQEKVGNPEMVSVQKNGEFVNREEYISTLISEGDEIDFLFFMGGGQNINE